MRKHFSILIICFVLLSVLAGCAEESVNRSFRETTSTTEKKKESPEDVAERHIDAMLSSDYKTMFSCMGVIWDEQCEERFGSYQSNNDDVLPLSVDVLQFEKFTGEDYEVAMRSISEDWINSNTGLQFVYSVSDIKQIGCVPFTMTELESGELVSSWICVVETEKGWFTASIDLY